MSLDACADDHQVIGRGPTGDEGEAGGQLVEVGGGGTGHGVVTSRQPFRLHGTLPTLEDTHL